MTAPIPTPGQITHLIAQAERRPLTPAEGAALRRGVEALRTARPDPAPDPEPGIAASRSHVEP